MYMTNDKVLVTKEGYAKLKNELEYLKTKKRAEVSDKIRIARGFGDLSENAEYDEAKAEQAKVETRIAELELQIKNASIIEESKGNGGVAIGDTVKILDQKRNKEMKFTIVGTVEADITEGKISNESPVGKALIGGKKGQVVDVTTRAGVLKYEIIEIVK